MNLKINLLLSLLILSVTPFDGKSQTWTNITTAWITSQGWTQSGGRNDANWNCSGVIVNRLTGDIVVNFSTRGLWRSSDQGITFERIDSNTVSGVNELPGAIQCDQDDPKRIANFSLDGTAAYTADGILWKTMTKVGRNWDLGTVDWSVPDPKVLIAAHHESSGELQLSTDGGVTWAPMSVMVDFQFSGTSARMIGIIDSTTFIYSNSNGINRSIDQGATWTNVSNAVTRTKVAVMFKGVCYVGTSNGLLVSNDKGATWKIQGAPIDIIQGPWFGADENIMVIVNANGMYRSRDAGNTWNLISGLTTGLGLGIWVGPGRFAMNDVTTWGGYRWDPVNNICYASALTSPVYKKELGPIDTIAPSAPTNVTASKITTTGFTVSWTASTDNVRVVSYEVFRGTTSCGTCVTTSLNVTGLAPNVSYLITVKAKDAEGNISAASDTLTVQLLAGFALWAHEQGLIGDLAVLFTQDRNNDGILNGAEYTFGANHKPGDPLLTIRKINGRMVVETPLQKASTLPYVVLRVLGSTNLIDWTLPVVPVSDTTGKPDNRDWHEPQGPFPDNAFFCVEAVLK